MDKLFALRAVAVFAAAVALFRAGQIVGRVPGSRRSIWALAGLAAAVVGAALHCVPGDLAAGPALAGWTVGLLGGALVPACAGFLLLAGIVSQSPERRLSVPFLAITTLGTATALFMASAAFAWWPRDARSLGNYPDEQGLLRQSHLTTCGAASGAMLLDRWGARFSEGQVAELGNTSPLWGTDLYALAWGLDHVVRRQGLRCRVAAMDFDTLARLQVPCVVRIHIPHRNWHAVVVERCQDGEATVADPGLRRRVTMHRSDFSEGGPSLVVWIERA